MIDSDTVDSINVLNFTLNIDSLDSENEKLAYNHFIRHTSNEIYAFRNGTSKEVDYYIDYIDEEVKIRSFFPDFILIYQNKSKKELFLLECKDINDSVDKNKEYKFKQLNILINDYKINGSYASPIFIYAGINKQNHKINFINDTNKKTFDNLKNLLKAY